jgi:hypothetical protein
LIASTINNMTYVSVRVYRSEAIWPPRYNWNIVKSGVKHHNPNTPYSANRYIFGSHDAQPQNNIIPILKYPGQFDNIFLCHKW